MEYVDGRSLADLSETGAVPVQDAVRYGIEAAVVTKQIRDALPDDMMRQRLNESEVVQRIDKFSSKLAENA